MLGVVVQIDGWDPVLGAPVSLRAGSHDDPAVCHLAGGDPWWPALTKLPTLRYDLFDGAFGGEITAPSSSLTLSAEPWANFGRYALADAQLQLWTGEVGQAWGAWTRRFVGRISEQPVLENGTASIDFAVDDRWLDRALLDTYAGTTGAEGSADLKGQPKPLALGAPRYISGTLVDSINSVFQLSAYGPMHGFEAGLEKLARFGNTVGDFASYAALVAANVPPGRWATAKAVGMARLGAPPTGQISFLVAGDEAGPNGWARKPGQIIRRLALLSGGAGKINDASLNALDVQRPYNVSVYVDQQTTARQLIQQIAASVNAVAGMSWTGELFVIPVGIGAARMTLAADGSALPPVTAVKQIGIASPFQKLAIGAERAWTVHALSDIAFTAPLIDVGTYADRTTYREGNIVSLGDGSRWLYIASVASAGHAPPAGTDGDAYWSNLSAPITATAAYADGTPLDDLRPAEPGATNSADPNSAFGPGQTVGDALDRFAALDEAIQNVGGDGATQAAIDARDAALVAAGNSEAARDQSQAARDAAKAAQDQALASARAAAGSLGTAQEQATIASQKADAAGEQATIASGKATIATTKAGEASISASEAATSESNAAGSAQSAARSATVSAIAVSDASGSVLTQGRSPGAAPGAWALNQYNTFAAVPNIDTSNAQSLIVNGSLRIADSGAHVHPIKPMPLVSGHSYELSATFRRAVDGPQSNGFSLYCTFWDKDGQLLYGNTYYYTSLPALSVAEGARTLKGSFTVPDASTVAFGRVMFRSPEGGSTDILDLGLADVTDREAAKERASAASTSASSAAAAADQSGQRASAAESARTDAQTAAGQASTYRDQASTSATNAAGSANTASTQAVVASRAAASMMPADFAQDGTYWMTDYQGAWEPARPENSGWAFPSVGTQKVARSPAWVGGDNSVHPSRQFTTRGRVRLVAGRRYRATLRSGLAYYNGAGVIGVDLYWLATDADGVTHRGSFGPQYPAYYDRTHRDYPAPGVVYDWTFEVDAQELINASAEQVGAGLAYYISPFLRFRGADGQIVDIYLFAFEDITESAVAAGFASAASTSATTAATRAGEAGTSASAAAASAQQASVFRDGASTSAQAAQGSAAAADGSRSSAASYAEAAAAYRNQATDAAAAAKSSADAVTDAGGALARRVDSVEATANSASASASTTAQAVSDVKTGLAGARLELLATSPGGPASVTIQSDSANGAVVRLVGAVEIDGGLTVNGSITTGKIANNAVNAGAAVVSGGRSFSTAYTVIAQVSYDVTSAGSQILVMASSGVLISSGAPVGTRANLLVSVNGQVLLSETVGIRGNIAQFTFIIPTSGLQGVCTFQMSIGASAGNGSDDPHTVSRPTLVVQELKR